MICEIAPAKINLYLHVGAKRADGLHDLASLFVFADFGDVLSVEPSDAITLEITGPFAAPLQREKTSTNLVMRAAETLKQASGARGGARMTLEKRLPIAAGVGGGSADAAAALRALVRLWGLSISEHELRRLAFRLGADVPACLGAGPVDVAGAGEVILAGPRLAPFWICLVNPFEAMPTGPIFRSFDDAHPNPPAPAITARRGFFSVEDIKRLMASTRNDLQPFAVARRGSVQTIIEWLSSRNGALYARMSGSGATVFALFTSAAAAARAATAARGEGWWAASGKVFSAEQIKGV